MFGFGMPELVVIGAILLVIFGPGKLPQLGASMGKALKGFRDGAEGADQKQMNEVSAKQGQKEEGHA
ncbi:MAG: twin-arginine translocase TatA/TatE family subunit [Desulfuromonadaceae bacterium]